MDPLDIKDAYYDGCLSWSETMKRFVAGGMTEDQALTFLRGSKIIAVPDDTEA